MVTWLVTHTVTYVVDHSLSHSLTWSITWLVTLSLGRKLFRPVSHVVSHAHGYSLGQSFGHSPDFSFGHSIGLVSPYPVSDRIGNLRSQTPTSGFNYNYSTLAFQPRLLPSLAHLSGLGSHGMTGPIPISHLDTGGSLYLWAINLISISDMK